MIVFNLSPLELLAGLAGLIVVVWIWRASVRRARRIATAARESSRLGSLVGRVAAAAAVFGGIQWIVLTHPGNVVLTAVVVGLPDLLGGYVLARALTVTTIDGERRSRRGGGRR